MDEQYRMALVVSKILISKFREELLQNKRLQTGLAPEEVDKESLEILMEKDLEHDVYLFILERTSAPLE